VVSDAEHELVKENRRLRAECTQLRAIAVRALRSLSVAQEAAGEEHEEWIDGALEDLSTTDVHS
jgi:hypothetical protein